MTALNNWTITPYLGLGVDFLYDHHAAYGVYSSIKLDYSLYYVVAGFETHYVWPDYLLGFQFDCMPMFNQFLKVPQLQDSAWILGNKVAVAAKIPFAYRFAKNYWLELAPYFRYLPIGSCSPLDLPNRNLYQVGSFLTFRFFL